MSEAEDWVVRRILVALDASAQSLAALEEAASLAASLEAELLGLFVEDINLVRLANLPFTRQISFFSAEPEALSGGRMEQELRAVAERMRQALEEAARRQQATCSFRIVRGDVTEAILEAAKEADLVLLGRTGRSVGRGKPLGSTAAAVVAGAPAALLLAEEGSRIGEPVATVYDGSPGSRQALRTALRMANLRQVRLLVLIPAAKEEEVRRLEQEVQEEKGIEWNHTRIQRLGSTDPRRVAEALRAESKGLVVLSVSGAFGQAQTLRTLLEQLPNPVLLLRREPGEPE